MKMRLAWYAGVCSTFVIPLLFSLCHSLVKVDGISLLGLKYDAELTCLG